MDSFSHLLLRAPQRFFCGGIRLCYLKARARGPQAWAFCVYCEEAT